MTIAWPDQPIWSALLSPDASTVATFPAGKTGEVRLWNAATGKEQSTCSGPREVALCVAFSPDSKLLAVGYANGEVRLWDAATGRERLTLHCASDNVFSLAFSPDCGKLATGSQQIQLWEVASGNELSTFPGHTRIVWSLAFAPDGKTLASGGMDKLVKLWDVATAKELASMPGQQSTIQGLVFSSDGKTLASRSADRSVRGWDVTTGKEKFHLDNTGDIHAMAFAPDGRLLVTGSASRPPTPGQVKFWDAATGRELASVGQYEHGVVSVVFAANGRTLNVLDLDRNLDRWNLSSALEAGGGK